MPILSIASKVNKTKTKKSDPLINKMPKLGSILSDDKFVRLFTVDIPLPFMHKTEGKI